MSDLLKQAVVEVVDMPKFREYMKDSDPETLSLDVLKTCFATYLLERIVKMTNGQD